MKKNKFHLGDKVYFRKDVRMAEEKYKIKMDEIFAEKAKNNPDFHSFFKEWLFSILDSPYQYATLPVSDKAWKSRYVIVGIERTQDCTPRYSLRGIYKNGNENGLSIAWVSEDVLIEEGYYEK